MYYEEEYDPHEDYDDTYYDEGEDYAEGEDEPIPEELEQASDAAEEAYAAYADARAKMRELAASRGFYTEVDLIDEQR